MRGFDLFQNLFTNFTQIRICLRERQLDAHTATHQDRQVTHQSIDASNASENPVRYGGLRRLGRTANFQSLTGEPDIIQEITDFVSDDAEKDVAVTFRPVREPSDYLCDRLIHGLVKPDDLRKHHLVVAGSAAYPQVQYARPQSPVFRNCLFETEARI